MAYSFDLKTNIAIEKAYLRVDDTTTTNNAYSITGYIPIVGGAQYRNYLSNGIWGVSASTNYYDIDKNLLIGFDGGESGRQVTVAPVDARFMRASVGNGNYSSTMVQETMTDVYPIDPDAPPVDPEPEPEPTPDGGYILTQDDIDLFTQNHVVLTVGLFPSLVGDRVDYGDTLTFDAMDGYVINAINVEYEMFVTGTFDVSSDGKQATLFIPEGFADVNLQFWDFNVVADSSTPVDPEPEPTIDVYTYAQVDKVKIENAKGQLFINGVLAVLGSTFVAGDVLEIRPLENYGITLVSFVSNDGYYKTFDIADGIASATMDTWDVDWAGWDLGEPINNSQLVGASFQDVEFESITPIPPDVEPTKGFNNVYLVDDENMKALSTKNFEVYFGSPDSPEIINYSKYIAGLINLPFAVDPELIRQTGRDIKLKDRSFNVNGDLLFTDVIRYDLGVISVPPNENNFLDYDGVTCFIHLPYCDSFNIDIDYVIGYDIGIIYDINLYDGMANINITSSKIGGVIESKRVNLGIAVPFGKLVDIPNNNDPKNVDLGGKNDVSTPYIEILKNDAVLPYGFFTTPISDESLLINQIGFVRIDEIDLKVTASKDEKEMILNVINQGVIIK